MIFVPKEVLESAERVVDNMFARTIELIKWTAAERRRLACYKAAVLVEVIKGVNELRIIEGKKPRRMWWKKRRVITLNAQCKAFRELHPELVMIQSYVDSELAVVTAKGWA